MNQHRRTFLASAVAGLALAAQPASFAEVAPASHRKERDCTGLEEEILGLFSDLPDRKYGRRLPKKILNF
jgi:hypothetical protein